MSRCFPYPPPGYQRADTVALIESIKKESDKQNKEKRNEKKREKKEREKGHKSGEQHGNLEHSHKKRKHDGSELHEKDGNHKKARKEVIEQLERSSLTEEHELPSVTQKPSESSESTQNSGKSRKPAVSDLSQKSTGGTIIRIKLPLLKHKDPEPKHKDVTPSATGEEPCFSGRITEAPTQSEPAAVAAQRKSKSERRSSWKPHSTERQYNDLIVNWKPPSLFSEQSDIGDEEWLFGTRKQKQQQQHPCAGAGGCGIGGGSSCAADRGHERPVSSLQPRACYLPELDMYQLPYAIPF